VVYTFLALCLAYVGGPGSVEVKMNGYQLYPSVLYCTCCLPALPVNGAFVRTCKRGALQFVWLKPVLAGLTVVLYTQRMYTEGYWGPDNGCARRARAPARTAPPALPLPCVRPCCITDSELERACRASGALRQLQACPRCRPGHGARAGRGATAGGRPARSARGLARRT